MAGLARRDGRRNGRMTAFLGVLGCLALLAAAAVPGARGAVLTGEFDASPGRMVQFLGKFCYDLSNMVDVLAAERVPQNVTLASAIDESKVAVWRMRKLSGYSPQYIVVYHDGIDRGKGPGETFEDIMRGRLGDPANNCEKFIADAHGLDWLLPREGESRKIRRIVSQSIRPRFWFVTAVNCQAPNPNATLPADTTFQYEIEFTNPGGFFARQFSKDEQGRLTASLAFLILYLPGVAVMFWGVMSKFSTQEVAGGFQVLTACVFSETLSLMLAVLHGLVFADDGKGLPAAATLGRVFSAIQSSAFMMLLIVMAKGWTTTYSKLRRRHWLINGIVGAALAVLYLLVLLWEKLGGVPADSYYLYDSAPGIVIVVVRMIVFLWFLFSARVRLAKAQDAAKTRFFKQFTLLGSLWFLSLPATVIVARFANPWQKAGVVGVMTLIINCIGDVLMAGLLWPSRVQSVFNSVSHISGPGVTSAEDLPPRQTPTRTPSRNVGSAVPVHVSASKSSGPPDSPGSIPDDGGSAGGGWVEVELKEKRRGGKSRIMQ